MERSEDGRVAATWIVELAAAGISIAATSWTPPIRAGIAFIAGGGDGIDTAHGRRRGYPLDRTATPAVTSDTYREKMLYFPMAKMARIPSFHPIFLPSAYVRP